MKRISVFGKASSITAVTILVLALIVIDMQAAYGADFTVTADSPTKGHVYIHSSVIHTVKENTNLEKLVIESDRNVRFVDSWSVWMWEMRGDERDIGSQIVHRGWHQNTTIIAPSIHNPVGAKTLHNGFYVLFDSHWASVNRLGTLINPQSDTAYWPFAIETIDANFETEIHAKSFKEAHTKIREWMRENLYPIKIRLISTEMTIEDNPPCGGEFLSDLLLCSREYMRENRVRSNDDVNIQIHLEWKKK